jgi:SmpA/OmlA family protein
MALLAKGGPMFWCVCVLVLTLGIRDEIREAQPACSKETPIVGRLLVWGVKVGMTPEQVERIFGSPTVVDSFTSGPIGQAFTDLSFSYLDYGVTVHFPLIPVGTRTGRHKVYERVRGGIE